MPLDAGREKARNLSMGRGAREGSGHHRAGTPLQQAKNLPEHGQSNRACILAKNTLFDGVRLQAKRTAYRRPGVHADRHYL
eukprot:295125-Pelagomonas_calceolata.AAC.3